MTQLSGLHRTTPRPTTIAGTVRADLGDSAGAIQDFDEALHLQPDYPQAYVNRGNVRSDLGDLAGAIRDFDAALRLKPDHVAAYNSRGSAVRGPG